MTSLIAALDVSLRILQTLFLAGAGVLAVVAATDWMVRTRRLNQFGRVARFMRSSVDPLMAPIEQRIIRAGGLPTNAPWWALAGAVFGAIVFLSLLGFLRDQLVTATLAMQDGGRGIVRIVIAWTFEILRLALIVRVLSSWIRVSPYSPWVRWAYTLTEPILRPLRQFIPAIAMIDITPIVAYLLLGLLQSFLLGLT